MTPNESFIEQNWLWFAIGLSALIIIVIIVALTICFVSQRKLKEAELRRARTKKYESTAVTAIDLGGETQVSRKELTTMNNRTDGN